MKHLIASRTKCSSPHITFRIEVVVLDKIRTDGKLRANNSLYWGEKGFC